MKTDTALPWPGAAAERLVLAALGTRPRGLFSDVDGTLAALAPTPEAAVLLPGVADLLRCAVAVFDVVAVVSGRSAHDTRRLVGVSDLVYIGNHGLERLVDVAEHADAEALTVVPEAEAYVTAIASVIRELEWRLAPTVPGIRFEAKGVTASIHVRGAAVPDSAEAVAYAAAVEAAQAYGLRVTRGKRVIELRPPLDVDKGVAVAQVARERGLRGALYLGDDRTDIDAFRALRRLSAEGVCRGVSVAVLHAEAPPELAREADVALSSIAQMPAFLRWMEEQAALR
jgi:trehalose 6-phosphate phosphatase